MRNQECKQNSLLCSFSIFLIFTIFWPLELEIQGDPLFLNQIFTYFSNSIKSEYLKDGIMPPFGFVLIVICVLGAVGLHFANRMFAVVNIEDHSTDSGPAQILPYTDQEEIKLCQLLERPRSLKINTLPYSFYLWRDLRPLLLSKVLLFYQYFLRARRFKGEPGKERP